jgi:glycosyltransferase involved in cell wall biosynthesis
MFERRHCAALGVNAEVTVRTVQLVDTLETGGAQKLLVTFAQMAHRRGMPVSVVSLREDDSPLAGELRTLGASVVAFPGRQLMAMPRMARLTRYLRRGNFQVVHAHLSYAIILGALAGRLVGLPVIASLHSVSGEPPNRFHTLRERLEIWALRRGVQRVVAVGQAVAEAYRKQLGTRPVSVVPNAVMPLTPLPEAERMALRTELAGDPARVMLISVGRLTYQKGYADLLTAFAALRASHSETFLMIVGGGAIQAELQAQITALGLQGHAVLLGERDDVPRLLAASDLFVSASHREGLSLAVLEAMSAGLPIVATRVGETPAIVGDEAGVIVPPHEPATLAAALKTVLGDPARRQAYAAASRARIMRDYSPEVWFERLMAVYREVLEAARLCPFGS